MQRREQRLAILRDIFAEEIAKVDPAFFQRMDESKFLECDKRPYCGSPLGRYTLFADHDYCDRDYHREFPTIYHLRRALMFDDRHFDVRLIYLAVHHILKKRGHFLFGDMPLENVNFGSCLDSLKEYLSDEYGLSFIPEQAGEFEKALADHTVNVIPRKRALRAAMGQAAKDSQIDAILDLLAGKKVKAGKLCAIELASDKSFSFKERFENDEEELCEILGDAMPLVYHVKRLYDWGVLYELRGGEDFLSCAKIKVYEQHRQDLLCLKALLKPFPQQYRRTFRISKDKLNNYVAYSGHNASGYRCSYDQFSKFLQEQLDGLRNMMGDGARAEADHILSRLQDSVFLPKQTTVENSTIPYQLHEQ